MTVLWPKKISAPAARTRTSNPWPSARAAQKSRNRSDGASNYCACQYILTKVRYLKDYGHHATVELMTERALESGTWLALGARKSTEQSIK